MKNNINGKLRAISFLPFCLFAFLLLAVASCTDKNDWDVDSQYDRLFHSTDFTVSAQADYAALNFTRMPNADYYVVEYSTDSLYDGIPMGGTAHSVLDSTITASPDTIYNLTGTTKYYIRILSRSNSGKSSTWKYPENYSFTTKAEQIIMGVTPYSRTADVTFTAGKQIDAAYVYHDGDSVRQAVSSAEVQAGALTLTNLEPSTSYTLKLWNGNTVRGSYSFRTTEAYPDGYTVITLSADDNLNDVLANATADQVVIVFPQGLNYTMPTDPTTGGVITPKIPANIKSVYFWGAAGETKPTFHAVGIGIDGSDQRDIVKFYNLNLVNDGPSGNYIVNFSGAPNITTLEMEKCDISDTRGVIRFQGITDNCTVGTINISNCVLTNVGSYGVLDARQGKLTVGSVNVTNSTLNAVGQGGSRVFGLYNDGTSFTMDHCTIYKTGVSTRQIVDINKKKIDVTISNCLIGPFYDYDGTNTIKGVSVKGTGTVSNTYYTQDMAWNSGFELGEQLDITSAQLWKAPDSGDFTIGDFYKRYESYGDPRWIEQ